MLKSQLNCDSAMQRNKDFLRGFIEMADSYHWDYWTTFTTNRPLSMQGARRLANVIANDFCKPSPFKSTGLLWVAEPFDTKVGYHIHALISSNLTIKGLLERKKDKPDRYGRIHIEPYERNKGAQSYCAKYIGKDLHRADWDINQFTTLSPPPRIEKIDGVLLNDFSRVLNLTNPDSIWDQIENNKL
jgi:hypothetical protein